MCAADEPTAWTHPLNVLVTVQSCVLCPAQASVSTTSCTTSSPCATQTRTWTSTSTASSAAWFGSKPCSVSQCLTCAVTNISCGSCGVSPALHPYFTLCVLIFFCFFFVYLSFSQSGSDTSFGRNLMWKYTFISLIHKVWSYEWVLQHYTLLTPLIWYNLRALVLNWDAAWCLFLFRGVPGLWSGWRRHNQAQCPGGKSYDSVPTVRSLHKNLNKISWSKK